MEQINRVQLVGIVGNSSTNMAGGRRVTRFSLATNRAYKDAMGEPKIETTWHNVSAWEGKDIPDPSQMQKGARLQVFGRIRNTKIQNEGQPDRYYSDIQALEIHPVRRDEPLVDEMN